MTEFRDLPTLVRRSFEEFVQRFQDDHPGSVLRRVSVPREQAHTDTESVYVIPFEDGPTGAKYEVTVSPAGAVFEPTRLA